MLRQKCRPISSHSFHWRLCLCLMVSQYSIVFSVFSIPLFSILYVCIIFCRKLKGDIYKITWKTLQMAMERLVFVQLFPVLCCDESIVCVSVWSILLFMLLPSQLSHALPVFGSQCIRNYFLFSTFLFQFFIRIVSIPTSKIFTQ